MQDYWHFDQLAFISSEVLTSFRILPLYSKERLDDKTCLCLTPSLYFLLFYCTIVQPCCFCRSWTQSFNPFDIYVIWCIQDAHYNGYSKQYELEFMKVVLGIPCDGHELNEEMRNSVSLLVKVYEDLKRDCFLVKVCHDLKIHCWASNMITWRYFSCKGLCWLREGLFSCKGRKWLRVILLLRSEKS